MTSKQVSLLNLSSVNANSKSTRNTQLSWNNINLRLLLGDMWAKYDLFNISLIEVGTGQCSNTITGNNLGISLNMAGLPWRNSGYNSIVNNMSTSVCMGTLSLVSNGVTSKIYDFNQVTFSKNQETVNLSIFYKIINDETMAESKALDYPNMNFIFRIEGVREDKDIEVSQRMV